MNYHVPHVVIKTLMRHGHGKNNIKQVCTALFSKADA